MKVIALSSALALVLACNAAIADGWADWKLVTIYTGAFTVGVLTIGPFVVTTDSAKTTSDGFSKKLSMAHEDAASYIATAGKIRGAQLESALEELRKNPDLALLDERQLVQAILVYSNRG